MTQIPYGYKIVQGMVEPDPDKVERLQSFISAYLNGMSIEKARLSSGLEVSRGALRRHFHSGVYAGMKIYPAIISEELNDQVIATMNRRGRYGLTREPDPLPVYGLFAVKAVLPPTIEGNDTMRTIQQIYDQIIPDEGGRRVMDEKDEDRIRKWMDCSMALSNEQAAKSS